MPASQALLFAKQFVKNPKVVASVVPSSPFLVSHLMSLIDWERARVLVEYGPGLGTITEEVLKRMRPDAVLVAIELNQEFAEILQRQIKDPRVHIVHGSAADVRSILAGLRLHHADCIISGIPFSMLTDAVRARVIRESRRLLNPDGVLLLYQFTSAVLPHLTPAFRHIDTDRQFLNFPPVNIYCCTP